MQPDLSWVGVLEHHALRTPDKPLAVHGGDVVTYRQMQDRAAALATGLPDLGVAAGDVVGLLSYNSLEFLEVSFAANHLGAIAMPINWRLAAAEVAYILEHSQARVFVCDEELLELGTDAADRLEQKMSAMRAHASQIDVEGPFFALSNNLGSRAMGVEYFRLVAGDGAPGPGGREDDLFAGIA